MFDFPLSLRSPVWLVALWLGGALLSETAAAERELTWWAGELSAAAGFDWSAGDYDEPGDDTKILYLPFSVSYRFDDWR